MGVWIGTAVLAGAVLMALEMVTFRLYAPYFGYSIYVWGSMISVIMAAMTCGYLVGGRVADRRQNDAPLYWAILFSALYQLLMLFVSAQSLKRLGTMDEFAGTTLATLLIFFLPIMSLSATGPYVIRLLARAGSIGSAAGTVYGLSTVGSIGGILVTTYYLVPVFGTQFTLRAACAATFVIAILGMRGRRRHFVAPAILFCGGWAMVPPLDWKPMAPLPESAKTIWLSESVYNLVRVMQYQNWTMMLFNDGRTAQTIRNRNSEWSYRSYHDMFAVGPLLCRAQNLLVLGMGAGSSIAATHATAPDIQIDAVEIDPKVVEAGEKFFGINPSDPKLRIHVADGRRWLARNSGQYDLIHVDIYQGGPYVPFYMTTIEFFQDVQTHLSADGIVLNNVFDPSESHEVLLSTSATMARVFPTVVALSDKAGSHLLLGFRRATSTEAIRERLLSDVNQTSVGKFATRAVTMLHDVQPPAGTRIFTDDNAPVDGMIRKMMQEYYTRQGI
jgi:predicted membrane-bound spermidine synthase